MGDSGLTVRIGADLGALADDLAQRLAVPVLPALETELVVVPTPGIARWLEARLSFVLGASLVGDGIVANVEFALSSALVRRVTEVAGSPAEPWTIGPMTMAAMAAILDGDTAGPLGSDVAPLGVFAAAREAADLFDRLFRWRPDVADEWLGGGGADPRAPLLRAVAERVGSPPPHLALATAIERLSSGDDQGLDLPQRLHVFGGETLPGGPAMPAMLDAIGSVRDVCVHLVVPSVERFEAQRLSTPRWVGRAPEPDRAFEDVHPLLASWGTSSADAAALVAQLPDRPTTTFGRVGASREAPSTVLGSLQRALRGDPSPAQPPDRSVWLHGCVGEHRQVEVLRDAILHLLDDDRTLGPGDVVVLCTDLPRFAPHLESVLGDPQGAPALPYVLRDRAISAVVPLIAGVGAALRLLGGRFPRSAVLDLLRDELVGRKFDLEEEDLDRIAQWTATAGVRWGLDAEARNSVGLPASFEAGTWRRALDRLLGGVALPDGQDSDVVALRAVDPGHNLDRMGALCDAVATLATLERSCAVPRALSQWCEFTREVLGALFATDRDDAAGREQLFGLLAGIEHDAQGADVEVGFAEYRALFDDRASQVRDLVVSGPGGVTITSLAPLRNVPHRVVAILGLDEAAVERTQTGDPSFGSRRVADPDPRADLRAALLGAVLAARQHLVVTFAAHDVVTNEPVPATSVLDELRESLDAACSEGHAPLELTHPRHAYGDTDLASNPDLAGRPFSFDRFALERAAELRGGEDRLAAAARRIEPTAPRAVRQLDRDRLVSFLKDPQKEFLSSTLRVRLPRAGASPDDELRTELDDLEKWVAVKDLVGEALSTAPGFGDDEWFAEVLERWWGHHDAMLADVPGRLGERVVLGEGGIAERARSMIAKLAVVHGEGPPRLARVRVAGPEGVELVAEIPVWGANRIVSWTPSSHDDDVRIESGVDLLLLSVAEPDVPWEATRLFRSGQRVTMRHLHVEAHSSDERRDLATRSLRILFDLHRRGMAEPVPLLTKASLRMAGALNDDRPPLVSELFAKGWDGYKGGDDQSRELAYCFDMGYEELCELEATDADPDVAFDVGRSRMLTYSLAMLEGLLFFDRDAYR